MDEQQDRGVLLSVLAGIGLGAIVGAAVALVLAPKSGAEVRDDLRVTLDDLKCKAEKVAADLSAKGEELVAKGRDVVESTTSRVKDAVGAGREAMEEARAEAEEGVEEVG